MDTSVVVIFGDDPTICFRNRVASIRGCLAAVTIGELLSILLRPKAPSRGRGCSYESGGAPTNVAVLLAKLGMKTAFLGKVGTDRFGELLGDTLQNYVYLL